MGGADVAQTGNESNRAEVQRVFKPLAYVASTQANGWRKILLVKAPL